MSSTYRKAEFEYHTDDLVKTVYQPAQSSPKTRCDYEYDNAGRVTKASNRNVNANQLISEYGLSYDDGANVITLNETQQVGGAPQTETQRFTFGGAMNRLSRAEYGNYQVNYSYNTAGNRVSETATGAVSSSRNYTYGVLGRLTQVTETAAETTTTGFDYDANGNLTQKTVTPQSGTPQITQYDFDIRDTLRQVSNVTANQVLGKYVYDYAGRRVKQETATSVLLSTYDGDDVLTEWSGTVQPIANSVWGGSTLLSRSEAVPARTNFNCLWNHLGSTANVFNATTNQVAASYRYDVWGVLRDTAPLSTNNNRRTFTGQAFDQESGLYCFGNGTRYLDPTLGQFTQKDPVYGEISDPRSLNPYSYAFNNPVLFDDPTGLQVPRRDEDPDVMESATVPNTVISTSKEEGVYKSTVIYFEKSSKPKRYNWNKRPDPFRDTPKPTTETIETQTTPRPPVTGTPTLEGVKTESTTDTSQPKPTVPKESSTTQPGYNPANDDSAGTVLGSYVGNLLGGFRDRGVETVEGFYRSVTDRRAIEQRLLNTVTFGGYSQYHTIRTYSQLFGEYTAHPGEVNDYVLDTVNQAGLKGYFGEFGHTLGEFFFDAVAAEVSARAVPGEGFTPTRVVPLEELPPGVRPSPAFGVCFVAGTQVLTRGGLKPIENLKRGEWVASYNEQTKQLEYQPIVELFEHQAKEVMNLVIEGEPEPIRTTPQHRFWVQRARGNLENSDDEASAKPDWMEAGNLRVGDQVWQASGAWVKVLAIGAREAGEWVYNFEVANTHTYFVGQQGVLVHNTNPTNPCAQPTSPLTSAQRQARIAQLAEENAGRRLGELENNVQGGHFYSRHGAPTTLAQQQIRASTGLTPDGIPKYKIDSSRFLSNLDQLHAIQRAQTIRAQTGANIVQNGLEYTIGEGYLKGGQKYVQTNKFDVRFDQNGLPYTAFPKLK